MIARGDAVALRSGGPPMVVEWINAEWAVCVWYVDGETQRHNFHQDCLDVLWTGRDGRLARSGR